MKAIDLWNIQLKDTLLGDSAVNLYQLVINFHKKFGIEPLGRHQDIEITNYRVKFLQEELDEIQQGYEDGNLEAVLDGLVDLVYVALGSAYMHGFDFNEAFKRVHAANLKKVRVTEASQSKRNCSLDVIKPEGWEPPYLADLVEDIVDFEDHKVR